MADEKVYMDLGMGMKETTVRDLIDASAFHRATAWMRTGTRRISPLS